MGSHATRTTTSVLLAATAATLLSAACDLPGLRPIEPDDTTGDTGRPLCEFGNTTCQGSGRLVCTDAGPRFRPCDDDEICQDAECRPVANDCDSPLPLRLSSSALTFDSNGRLRPDSASLEVENCGEDALTLTQVSFHQPASRVGRPIFSVANRVPVANTKLPPGDSLGVKLRYGPRFGFFLSSPDPTARVELRVRRSYEVELDLRRRIDCVTAAPRVDFGAVKLSESAERSLPLANCGNQRAVVPLADSLPVERAGYLLRRAERAPESVVLEPGASSRVPLVFEARSTDANYWEPLSVATLRLGASDSARPGEVETSVRAQTRPERCSERTAPLAAYRQSPPDFAGSPESDPYTTGDAIELRPLESVWLRTRRRGLDPPDGPPTEARPLNYRVVDRPDGSHARVRRDPRSDVYRQFVPDRVGTYRVRVRSGGERRAPNCPVHDSTFTVEARPAARLYVELSWSSADDPVEGDEGYGRGADLNLHLLRTDADALDATGWFTDRDCFQPGRRLTRRCPGSGTIRSADVSGAAPEAIAYDGSDGARFCAAVQMWNPYRFNRTRAHLRIYEEGTLLEPAPLTRTLGGTRGTVWFVGCYDTDAAGFEPVDAIRKSF